MRTVDVKVLKNRLSEYIRLVNSGEIVLVTDGGRVVAELLPPQGHGPSSSGVKLAEAMRRGWLSAPLMVRNGPPPRMPVAPLTEVLRSLDVDRHDR